MRQRLNGLKLVDSKDFDAHLIMIEIVYSSWLCEYMLHMLLTPDGPDLLILLQSLGKTKKLIEAESICKSTIFLAIIR